MGLTYIPEIDKYLSHIELDIWEGKSILHPNLVKYYKDLWTKEFYDKHPEFKHTINITVGSNHNATGTSIQESTKLSSKSFTEADTKIVPESVDIKRKLKLITSCSYRIPGENITCGCNHYCTLKALPAQSMLCLSCVENKLSKMSKDDITKLDEQKGYMSRIKRPLFWAYGVTTVPGRRSNTLPRTLASLRLAGFYEPRLFIDGCSAMGADSYEKEFKLPVTSRDKNIRTFGNWYLALHELFIRNPLANRYAIFQDDLVTYRNLRGYLDESPYPDKGYLNLFTFPVNQEINKKENGDKQGWFKSNQMGKGAVALVFDRDATLALLSSFHMAERPTDQTRGHRAVDGAIVTALKQVSISEYCHNPSLVYHIGDISSMNNPKHPNTQCFLGEEFDATNLLEKM